MLVLEVKLSSQVGCIKYKLLHQKCLTLQMQTDKYELLIYLSEINISMQKLTSSRSCMQIMSCNQQRNGN